MAEEVVAVEEGGGTDGGAGNAKIKSEKDGSPLYMDTTTNGSGDATDSLASELDDLLRLTPDQKANLRKSTEGIKEECRAVEVVDASLTALLLNS